MRRMVKLLWIVVFALTARADGPRIGDIRTLAEGCVVTRIPGDPCGDP